jgi:hypothetical protein
MKQTPNVVELHPPFVRPVADVDDIAVGVERLERADRRLGCLVRAALFDIIAHNRGLEHQQAAIGGGQILDQKTETDKFWPFLPVASNDYDRMSGYFVSPMLPAQCCDPTITGRPTSRQRSKMDRSPCLA